MMMANGSLDSFTMQHNPSFVRHRPILTSGNSLRLHELSSRYPLERFRGDPRNYEEVAVDFVYTSAKIEGNTYDRIDTDNLLRLGITAGGKRYSDAVMLVNLREGFERAMSVDGSAALDLDYLCDMHQCLMNGLLPAHEQGIVRTTGGGPSGLRLTSLPPPLRRLRFRRPRLKSWQKAQAICLQDSKNR